MHILEHLRRVAVLQRSREEMEEGEEKLEGDGARNEASEGSSPLSGRGVQDNDTVRRNLMEEEGSLVK